MCTHAFLIIDMLVGCATRRICAKIDYNHYNPNGRYLRIWEKFSVRKCCIYKYFALGWGKYTIFNAPHCLSVLVAAGQFAHLQLCV